LIPVRFWDGLKSAILSIPCTASDSKCSKKRRVAGVDTLMLRELERGTFSVAREWTDWADPTLSDSLGLPPQRLDARSLLELVTLLEVLTKSKQIG
jgi:hypothetical protein